MQIHSKAFALELLSLFPKHKVYIEPYFTDGRLFIQKPLAEISLVTDLDYQIRNFLSVLRYEVKAFYDTLAEHQETVSKSVKQAIDFFLMNHEDLLDTPDLLIEKEGQVDKLKYLVAGLRIKLKAARLVNQPLVELLNLGLKYAENPKACFVFINLQNAEHIDKIVNDLVDSGVQFAILCPKSVPISKVWYKNGLWGSRISLKGFVFVGNYIVQVHLERI